jgi:carboxyl-terminal processing protease
MRNKKGIFKSIALCMSLVMVVLATSANYKDGSSSTFLINVGPSNVIDEVRSYLKSFYVDPVPDSTLNLPTVDAIIKEINKTDPHTTYFTADKYTEFQDTINNTFSGIGVQIEMVPQGVQIISVFDGSPAQEVKIQPGDIITMADTHELAGVPDDVAVGYIKGPEGTSVKLTVKRKDTVLTLDVVRRKINAPTVTGKILDNHIGYIDISSFGTDTSQKFGEQLKTDESKNVDSYIVDLRYNGGGYLDTALDIAGYFVGNNLALITKGRMDGETKKNAVKHSLLINKPVIFLINEYSASASEILSGVMRDYNKAYFLGVRSYGKGSVQMPIPLSNKDVLKMTIDKFYSPKGITIDKVGITPNMLIPDDVDSMKAAEMILDSPKTVDNNRGYFKITTNGKTIIGELTRAEDADFWQSYNQLINLSAKGNGSVMFGTGKGWAPVTKDKLSDKANIYYPNYKIKDKETGITTDSAISIKFDDKVLKSSVNDKNIELIDSATGSRSTVEFAKITDNEAVVSPKEKFKNNKLYYLVVSPKVQNADSTPISKGFIYELKTTN